MRVTASQARARLGLPLHEAETETMFGAIAQQRPVFNGYSGYAAPQHARFAICWSSAITGSSIDWLALSRSR